MSKARKVKSTKAAEPRAKAPRAGAKPGVKRSRAKPAPARSAVHKFTGKRAAKGRPAAAPEPEPKLARLAAVADGEPEVTVASSRPGPKGGVAWEDWEDDDTPASGPAPRPGAPVAPEAPPAPLASPARPAPADGVEVVAKGPSKFSLADLELLKASIKVKGAATVIDGINLEELKWDAEGLVPVVAQDRRTGAVLTLGHMNRATLESSLRNRTMSYWDRTNQKVREMGEGSGHAQRLARMSADCDKDALLAVVDQEGAACTKEQGTCWTSGRSIPLPGHLGDLDRAIHAARTDPAADPAAAARMAEPIEALRAFVQAANELTRAIQGKTEAPALEREAADVVRAMLVTLRTKGVGLPEVVTELYARHMAEQMGKAKG